MAQNRTIPYGYQIRNGSVVLHEEESEIVRRIYYDYAEGKSYKVIADSLTLEGVRYMPDKPTWNKNMVARILQNESYNGSGKYPAIVSEKLSRQSECAKRQSVQTISPELKAIKPMMRCGICGGKIQRRVERRTVQRWYCENSMEHISTDLDDARVMGLILALQHNLSGSILEQILPTKTLSFEVVKLQKEIDRLLNTTGESIANIQSKMLELTNLQYSLCDDTHHIEQSILEKLGDTPDILQPKLLSQLTESISLIHTHIKGITLKNGLTIQRGEEHD